MKSTSHTLLGINMAVGCYRYTSYIPTFLCLYPWRTLPVPFGLVASLWYCLAFFGCLSGLLCWPLVLITLLASRASWLALLSLLADFAALFRRLVDWPVGGYFACLFGLFCGLSYNSLVCFSHWLVARAGFCLSVLAFRSFV